MAEDFKRDDIKKFFDWKRKRRYRRIAILALLGALYFGFNGYAEYVDYGNYLADEALVAFAIAIALLLFSVWMYRIHRRQGNLELERLYENLQRVKQHDLVKVVQRSFKKIDTDIDDLLDFDARDFFEGAVDSGAADVGRLLDKSVVLTGRPGDMDHIRFVKVDGRLAAAYTPIKVSIIYLTAQQLITYFAIVDLKKGDLRSEQVDRVYLHDIVQIGTSTDSKRFERDAGNTDLFEGFTQASGEKPDELVRRQHVVSISKTDGNHLLLPVGAPEYQDGSKGQLEMEEVEDDRSTRVARSISQRINDAKALASGAASRPDTPPAGLPDDFA